MNGCRVLFLLVVALGMIAPTGKMMAQQAAASDRRGDEYILAIAKMYQRHIYDHAQILHQYGALGATIPDEVLKEHLSGMRSELSAAKATFARLSNKAKNHAETNKKLATVEAKFADIGKAVDALEKASASQQDTDSQAILNLTKQVTSSAKAAHAATHEAQAFYIPEGAIPHFDQGVFAN